MTRITHYWPDIRTLLLLGLPLVGSQLAQVSIQIIDTLMLGRYDVEVLAAVVLGNSLFFSIFLVGSGFAWAVTPLVATAAAQNDSTRVRRVARMGIWVSAGFTVLAMPVLLSGETLLLALGQDQRLSEIARSYLDIAAWGLAPALGVMILRAYLAGLRRTGVMLWLTLGASVFNAFLNWVLIFGNLGAPELGARGAALASVTMHGTSFIILAIYAQRSFPQMDLFARMWRPDWVELRQVFQLGWPIGVATLAETGLFSASAIMVGWIGAVELAAHGIALQLATIAFMSHLGLSQAATVLAGDAFGRNDMPGLRRGAVAALLVSGGFAVVSIALMVAMPQTLLSLFMDPGEPLRADILAVGTVLVFAAAVFQGADGAQVVLISLLRGIHDTRVPMILTTISYWGIGAPLGYALGIVAGIGAVGVWSGLVAGLFCAAVLLWHRLYRQRLPALEST